LIAALAASRPPIVLRPDSSSNQRRTASPGGIWTKMKNTSEHNPSALQLRRNSKHLSNAMPRTAQSRGAESSGFPRSQARNSQSAQGNYQRYLNLARAEALTGDRIAAENYFQHAEHYFRSMQENAN
jgi:hypothetical protein